MDQNWIHQYQHQEEQKTCSIGEHLISQYPQNPIAIFESFKNCIYYMIEYGLPNENSDNPICIAIGSLGTLNEKYLSFLKDKPPRKKRVFIYPNSDAVDDWSQKEFFNFYTNYFHFEVIDINKKHNYPNSKEGYDIADYLTWKWKQERQNLTIKTEETTKVELELSPINPIHYPIEQNTKTPLGLYQLLAFTEEELQLERNLENRLLY